MGGRGDGRLFELGWRPLLRLNFSYFTSDLAIQGTTGHQTTSRQQIPNPRGWRCTRGPETKTDEHVTQLGDHATDTGIKPVVAGQQAGNCIVRQARREQRIAQNRAERK